jgi:hypothetical protein
LKRDLDLNKNRADNHPVYEFESMSIYEFGRLFDYKKTPDIDDGDDDENDYLKEDNEPKDISRQKFC